MLDECNFFLFSFSPSSPFPLLLLAGEQEALHHPDRQRKRREGERKRDCDGGIKGYPSLSVTSFIVPCSVLPAHPSSAVTHTEKYRHTASNHFHTLNNADQRARIKDGRADTQTLTCSPPCFTHSLWWHTNGHTHTHTLRSASHSQTHSSQKATQTFVRTLRPISHIHNDDRHTNIRHKVFPTLDDAKRGSLTRTFAPVRRCLPNAFS